MNSLNIFTIGVLVGSPLQHNYDSIINSVKGKEPVIPARKSLTYETVFTHSAVG